MTTLAEKLLLSVNSKGKELKKRNDELRNLQRLVWLLVMASGGTVRIPKSILENFDPKRALITMYTSSEGDYVYEAQESKNVQAD